MKIVKLILIVCISIAMFSCKKEMATEQNMRNDTLYKGVIFVNSNPPGSKIYVDSMYSGLNTPDSARGISYGSHSITLKQELLPDTTIICSITENIIPNINVDYYADPKNYGSIFCQSFPSNADITINNVSTSIKTPFTFFHIFPGKYNVKYSLKNYRADSITVKVHGSQTSPIYITLEDTTVWVDYTTSNSKLPDNYTVAIKGDSRNNIWIGTASTGLAKFSGNKFTLYNSANSGLIGNDILSIDVDVNDNIWIGTSDGISKFDGANWINYTSSNSIIKNNFINVLICTVDGKTWAGTLLGLVCIDNSGVQLFTKSNSGLLGNIVSGLYADKEGRIWVACGDDGVCYLQNGVWHRLNDSNGDVFGRRTSVFAEDNSGAIWGAIDTMSIWKYYNGVLSDATIPAIGSKINCFVFEASGDKWIATDANGAFLLKPNGTLIHYLGGATHINSTCVKGIYIDKNNAVWFATFKGGVVKYKR